MIKRRTQARSVYESFTRNLACTVIPNALSELNPELDTLPLIFEHLKSKIALQDTIRGGVNCVVSTARGVAVGGTGYVRLMDNSAEYIQFGPFDQDIVCMKAAGNTLIAGSWDGKITAWNIATTSKIIQFEAHKEPVNCLETIGNGEIVVTGSNEEAGKIWHLSTGLAISALPGHEGGVTCLLLKLDESVLVTAAGNGALAVWKTGKWAKTLLPHLHSQTIEALVGTSDGRYFCSASADWQIGVWLWANHTLAATLTSHTSRVWTLAVSPNSQYLFSASADKTVKVWNLSTFVEVQSMMGQNKAISALLVTPDSKFLITSAEDAVVRVWELSTFTKVATLKGHQTVVFSLALCPDGSRFLSGAKDGSIRIWSLDTSPESSTILTHSASVNCVGISPDMNYVVSGSADSTLKVFNKASNALTVLRGHTSWVTCLVITADSKIAISGADDYTLKAWNLDTCEEVTTFTGHTKGINSLITTPNSMKVISASSDSTVKVWKLTSLKLEHSLDSHTGPVLSLALTQDGKTLFTGSADATIKMWSLVSYTELLVFTGHTASVVGLSTDIDTRKMISRAANGELKIWDTVERTEIHSFPDNTDSTCFLCNEEYIITGHTDGTIRVKDAKTPGETVAVLYGHSRSVSCLRLTPDNRNLISSALDNILIAWSLEHMKEEARYSVHSEDIKDIAIAADSTFLVSASLDSSVQQINLIPRVATCRTILHPISTPTLSETGRNTFFGSAVEKLKRGKVVHRITASHLVMPYCFNALHVCAYYNNAVSLMQFLRCQVPIVKGSFGSPLTVAFKQNTRKCVDVVLGFIIEASEKESCWAVIQEITDDIPSIIQTNSKLLPQFLTCMFRLSQQPSLPYFIIPKSSTPLVHIAPNWYVNVKAFENTLSGLRQEVVDFYSCEFCWNFTSGSSESLELLTALESCYNRTVLTTPFVESLLHWKWRLLMPFTLILTVLFISMLLCMIALVFEYGDAYLLKFVFFLLNLFFLVYEGLQSYVSGASYWRDPWNYIDWVRSVICVVWILFLHTSQYVDLIAVCMCFFRGFTYFRTFKMTRLFVRLTLEVVKEMYSFLIIFAYSTIAFGMMYAVLVPEQIESAFKAWMTAYELLMGTYSTDGFHGLQWMCFTFASLVNVIIMFNLLIAILGDAYEQAQMSAKENDTLEMLRIIIEYESMLFWKRGFGQKSVFSLCAASQNSDLFAHWGGKILVISSEINNQINAKAEMLASQMDRNDAKLDLVDRQLKLTSAAAAESSTSIDTLAVTLEGLEDRERRSEEGMENRVRRVENGLEELEKKIDLLVSHLAAGH